MNETERKLFKQLCNFKSAEFDEALLEQATPEVLGQLFFNRMQGIAYDMLYRHGQLGKVHREFRNSLQTAYEQNQMKNNSFFHCVELINNILAGCGFPYAMLKGAYLCRYYPIGYRTSNDIDLLVLPEDVTKIGNLLTNNGFCQGYIRNGIFEKASRQEIIQSKMMRGETVPYIREVNLPWMKYLEVDINFSLDYKPGDTELLKQILKRSYAREVNGMMVTTLDEADFFIHLCSHLYKEATTLPWIEMNRDMTLYKYADIYMLLADAEDSMVAKIMNRAKELDMEKVCAFVILQTAALFDIYNDSAITQAKCVLSGNFDFLHTVFNPREKKQYRYTEEDVCARFFDNNRNNLLQEVISDGTIEYATK